MNDSKINYKDILNPDEYRIAREGATEAPFTGKYCSLFEPGTYLCICCSTPLFSSETKYDSLNDNMIRSHQFVQNEISNFEDVTI